MSEASPPVMVFSGSRDFPASRAGEVLHALRFAERFWAKIFVGDCPTGLDACVRSLCSALECEPTIFRADWPAHGKAAGPMRNQAMIDAALKELETPRNVARGRPMLCAWPIGDSRGTRDCIRRAQAARFEVRVR